MRIWPSLLVASRSLEMLGKRCQVFRNREMGNVSIEEN